MKITVILCTYNRAHSIGKALESVLASILPSDVEWELLVVDNNSKDHTRATANEFCRRYPGRVRYFFEAQQGLSNARNAGIREARGEIIAFTDDDVTVAPNWLQELTSPFQNQECAGVGGRVYLPKDFSPPRWMALEGQHSLAGVLAFFDLGSEAGPLFKPFIGANMAFRKKIFETNGGFRADLGRTADSLISNEETEFGKRLLSAGQRLWYQPSAVVYHPVPKERVTKKYFRAWWFAYGRAAIRLRESRSSIGIIPHTLISLANRLFRLLPQRIWYWVRESKPQKKFFNQCQIWKIAGELVEICSRSFGAKSEDPSLQSQVVKTIAVDRK